MPIKPEKTPKLPENWPIKGNGGKLVGARAAAEILGLCPHSVSELCSKKIMCVPFYKIGGRFMFDLADLEAYIRKARVEGKKGPSWP
jgi:hypothetical protein